MSSSATLLKRLKDLARDFPHLQDIARLYEMILPLLDAAHISAEPVAMDGNQAREKLMQGSPLLQDAELHLDNGKVRRLLIELARAVEQISGEARKSCRELQRALKEDKIEISRLMAGVVAHDQEAVQSLVQPMAIDSRLVTTLTSYAFKPALHFWRRQLSPLLEEAAWSQGYCPICGALPLFAELQGKYLNKHLRCGMCGSDWPGRRLHCQFCGNEDHRTLGVFFEESRHDNRRVEFCEQCRIYLKVIVAYEPTPPEQLPVVDLATIHLNFMAEEHGYRMNVPGKTVNTRNQIFKDL